MLYLILIWSPKEEFFFLIQINLNSWNLVREIIGRVLRSRPNKVFCSN